MSTPPLHTPAPARPPSPARRACLRAAAAALAAASPLAAARTRDARLQLFCVHTKEFLDVVYRRGDRYDRGALDLIDSALRDHRDNISVVMDRELIELMSQLHRAAEARSPFRIVSGYRTPKTNAWLLANGHQVSKNSYHLYGQAVDLFIPEIPASRLARVARRLGRGGVGLYSGKGFVHVDTGPVRSWGR